MVQTVDRHGAQCVLEIFKERGIGEDERQSWLDGQSDNSYQKDMSNDARGPGKVYRPSAVGSRR